MGSVRQKGGCGALEHWCSRHGQTSLSMRCNDEIGYGSRIAEVLQGMKTK